MRFSNPYLLLLLLIVPLLLWWRSRRRASVNFPDGALLKKLPVSLAVRLQPVLPVLYAAGLVCLIAALARPQRGMQESQVNTEGVDIVLLLDLSQSMEIDDFAHQGRRQSRLDSAKQVIDDFVQNRADDRIGLVGFASQPYSVAPLTLDHGWLELRLQGLNTRMLNGRNTAIGDALASAVNRLRDSEAKSRIVILLTDGENNHGELTPENAAQAAAALGIKVYTIGIGGGLPVRRGFFSSAPEQIDTTAIEQVAEISGGQFFRATDLDGLKEVYDTIDELEKTEIEMLQFTRYEETAQSWLIAAALFLALERLLSLTRYGRLPE